MEKLHKYSTRISKNSIRLSDMGVDSRFLQVGNRKPSPSLLECDLAYMCIDEHDKLDMIVANKGLGPDYICYRYDPDSGTAAPTVGGNDLTNLCRYTLYSLAKWSLIERPENVTFVNGMPPKMI